MKKVFLVLTTAAILASCSTRNDAEVQEDKKQLEMAKEDLKDAKETENEQLIDSAKADVKEKREELRDDKRKVQKRKEDAMEIEGDIP